VRPCAGCGAGLPPSLLACPSCGHLVHAEALKGLAGAAERAEQAGDLSAALAAWREALGFLPPGALQRQRIAAKVEALSAALAKAGPPPQGAAGAAPAAQKPTGWKKWAAGLGGLGVLLAKGKMLLIGLTKAKTLLSMAIAVGVYTTIFGWRLALGLVVTTYIHEMGHVARLRHYGIPASAPMFIPGLGAFVRFKNRLVSPGEDARVGLAGPLWGAAATIGALGIGIGLHRPTFIAIAYVSALINLLNLVPFWQLDGNRGFAALSRRQRGIATAVLFALVLWTQQLMFLVLAIAATARAVERAPAPEIGDRNVLTLYVVLVLGLITLMKAAVHFGSLSGLPGVL
jgi:Zn-dependent protease